ncbi:hypothetical protein PtrSN002B_008375 [Pyrenophora tritici-repentis]|uniref:Uncharacterized protein n=2 Tax=Pyrenophora tritici-repentis TaxID=45151 RepID=A0A2W1I157_9PLEO|nr:uncharacterized protein PTRG_05532 [Pyrenophora tritici-repentis Pt-1C-BFP]KAA8618592.1 hypothetical protein PtrV1_08021 [Pyrenophora tritici-repentis]EDU48452.1 predicted protein [Pyrenophora tritici-repentis Pt-1C-BFP]KAF7449066.1 hypothetical protein A1F99_061150 [Pyrenophora tritici-repentis]KAF7570935.1 hypothetical protein PtrM4_109370 [Pyrenophora tritici-repentis]KAG9383994.1 hypothetical protein A1F94_005905 [Pyrenophora tritici-repentis]
MNASNASIATMRATTYGPSEQEDRKRSSLEEHHYESSSNFKDIKNVGSTFQGYSSDLLGVGTWVPTQQNPGTAASPEEARKGVPQHPCTHHQAIHAVCLGSSDDHRAIISLLDDPYATGSTDHADRMLAGPSSAAACTCVTDIQADIDGAQVTAVTTNGAKPNGRQTHGIK